MPRQLEFEFDDLSASRLRPPARNRLPGRASVLIQPLRRVSLRVRARRTQGKHPAAETGTPREQDGVYGVPAGHRIDALAGPDDAYFDAWVHAHYDRLADGADGADGEGDPADAAR